MKDPMQLAYADDPRLIWVGYPHVAAPDRFAVPDEAAGVIYMYVPLDVACRWDAEQSRLAAAGDTVDERMLEIRFHTTPDDEARLARARERYGRRAALALDLWDHAPKSEFARAQREAGGID